ncbi:glycosyltransferase [Kineosporia sp. R_H_3]|uniref:glycosyltransferase n=1 Tax=Kineosporia sp. R_H_3 TaxID=1961848 RepID=UPI000B4A5D8F|nr:glycosyltransferase [Kineosporia sp. R_H_3]
MTSSPGAEALRALRRRAGGARRALTRAVGLRPGAGGSRAEAVLAALDAGLLPPGPDDVTAAVAACAAEADAALARSGPASAAEPLARAAAIAFHRTLHFDGTSSPLVDSSNAFMQPLLDSTAWVRATRPRPRRRQPPAAVPTDRPHRLLLVTLKNWKFLEPVAAHYTGRPGVEVRRLDLADLPGLPLSPLQQLRLRLSGPDDARSLPWARPLAEAVDGADTVFLDWLQRGAVLLTALDPGRARVVVRLHSFETFTVFPHLVGYDRVDDLVVVGPHLGRLLDHLVPDAAAPRRHVLANLVDLHRFDRPKPDDARFTLAVVGYGVVAKDPLWAVETLALLRRQDPRYRLLLVGDDLDPAGPAGAAGYRQRLEERLAAPDVAGAVERVPFTPDVPDLLRRVGVVVSSSVRESFHLGLVEGVASGAVPVVRDWPLFAAVGGPHDLFPSDWVTPEPAAAAARVLACTADVATWRAAGAAAAGWVRDRYDARTTQPRYDDLLLGR